eukprot:13618358-Ditylum_brightwellii.AAC.2
MSGEGGCNAVEGGGLHHGATHRISGSKLDAPCVPETSFHGQNMCSVFVGMSWDATMPQTPMS